MDAIVTAGGIPLPEDPLYTYTNGDSKALVDMAGKPMIQWVLDALGATKRVENVIVVGLSPKSGLTCKKPLHYLSNQGRLLANVVAGIEKVLQVNPKARYALVISSDVPGIKSEMIDWLVETVSQTKDDLYYGVIPREVMEKRYPGVKRAYVRMKDMQFCEAGLHVLSVRALSDHMKAWNLLFSHPRGLFGQPTRLGFGTFIQFRLGNLTVGETVERFAKRIGVTSRPVVWKHAEPGMDVDKPHQLELLRADLEKQVKKAARKAGKTGKSAGRKVPKPRKKGGAKVA